MKKSVFLVHVYWIGKNSTEWLTANVPVIWYLSSKFLIGAVSAFFPVNVVFAGNVNPSGVWSKLRMRFL